MSEARLLHDRYRIIKTLHMRDGHPTYLAEDTEQGPGPESQPLQKQVIIKQLNVSHVKDWSELDLFEREVNTLAQLNHPHIPKLLDHFRDESTENGPEACYLVQTAITGQTLRQILEQEGALSEERVSELAHQLLGILSYLHTLNPSVIHRDIKPENIIIDPQGQAHLIDFGAVRDATLMNQMTVAGTFGYMPPEQAAGQVKPATDIYALGVTLIECLSACAPHTLPQDQQLRLLYHDRVTLTEPFQRWLDVLTDPVIDHRPRNAQEALHWLDAKALPESIGRLQVEYPKPGRVELVMPTQNTDLTPQQLLWQSAQNQLSKTFVFWFLYWSITFPILVWGTLASGHIGNFFTMLMESHPFSLGFAGIFIWLTIKEYDVLKAQSLNDVRVILEGEYLLYGIRTYQIAQLVSVDYATNTNYRVAPSTQTTLSFKHTSLALPVRLTKAEEQLFDHVLQKHKRNMTRSIE